MILKEEMLLEMLQEFEKVDIHMRIVYLFFSL